MDLLSNQLTCSLVPILRLPTLLLFGENSLVASVFLAWPELSPAEVGSIVTPHLTRDHVILHTRHDIFGIRLPRTGQMISHQPVDFSLAKVSRAARVLGLHDLQGALHPPDMSEEILQGDDTFMSLLVLFVSLTDHLY
jgi:hypothetical protein